MIEDLDNSVCFAPTVTTEVVDGKTVATLTFSGDGIVGGSLADGNYRLHVIDTIVDVAGNQLDGDGDGTSGGNATDDFFRFYGDTTGDRNVNIFDLLQFRKAFGTEDGDAEFNAGFDSNGDNRINVFDLLAFRSRFGKTLDLPS
jgi:hypothetical protein